MAVVCEELVVQLFLMNIDCALCKHSHNVCQVLALHENAWLLVSNHLCKFSETLGHVHVHIFCKALPTYVFHNPLQEHLADVVECLSNHLDHFFVFT